MEIIYFILFSFFTLSIKISGRNVQRQVDNLERRYENDYVSIKENIRDLWANIDQLETACSARNDTRNVSPTFAPPTHVQHKNIIATKATSSDILARLLQALSDEKEYIRNGLKNITELVSKTQSSCMSTISEKMRFVGSIDARCSRVENDLKKWHKKQTDILEKVELLENNMETEISDLRLVVNQALEEVMQNSLNKPASCMDMVKAGVTSSGVYTLHYKMQPFIVYCLMSKGRGYTFISPETYMNVDIKTLSNDNSHVIFRHRRTNGLQYETRIEQITRYMSRPLSVQYNYHVGYAGVVNYKMGPYIYVGLNPLKLENGRSQLKDRQGYKSNGKEFTFVNCDGNPNGYFAFLFNHIKAATVRTGESSAISRKWIESSARVTREILPDKFMSFFELHFGGCGAFAGTNHIAEVTGAAVGIPFTLP